MKASKFTDARDAAARGGAGLAGQAVYFRSGALGAMTTYSAGSASIAWSQSARSGRSATTVPGPSCSLTVPMTKRHLRVEHRRVERHIIFQQRQLEDLAHPAQRPACGLVLCLPDRPQRIDHLQPGDPPMRRMPSFGKTLPTSVFQFWSIQSAPIAHALLLDAEAGGTGPV